MTEVKRSRLNSNGLPSYVITRKNIATTLQLNSDAGEKKKNSSQWTEL
jgi:hypothetical protein